MLSACAAQVGRFGGPVYWSWLAAQPDRSNPSAAFFRVQVFRRRWCVGATPFVLALAGWAPISCYLAPYRGFAASDLVRVYAGASAFVLLAFSFRRAESLLPAIASLAGIAVLTA